MAMFFEKQDLKGLFVFSGFIMPQFPFLEAFSNLSFEEHGSSSIVLTIHLGKIKIYITIAYYIVRYFLMLSPEIME